MKEKNKIKFKVFFVMLALMVFLMPNIKAVEGEYAAPSFKIRFAGTNFDTAYPNTEMKITNVANSNIYYIASTDLNGQLYIPSVPCGTYEVEVVPSPTINFGGDSFTVEHGVSGTDIIIFVQNPGAFVGPTVPITLSFRNYEDGKKFDGTFSFEIDNEDGDALYRAVTNEEATAYIPYDILDLYNTYTILVLESDIDNVKLGEYPIVYDGSSSIEIVLPTFARRGNLNVKFQERTSGRIIDDEIMVRLESKSEPDFWIETMTDYDNGATFYDLPYGDYILTIEDEVMFGFKVPDPIELTVNNNRVDVVWLLEYREIGTDSHGLGTLFLKDSTNGKIKIPNLSYQILNDKGEIVLFQITDEGGNTFIPLDLFEIGKKYYIELIAMPEQFKYVTPGNKPYEFTFTEYTDLECEVQRIGYKGDINNDGKINSSDAALALQLYGDTPTANELKAGDMDGNGKINSTDAAIILEFFSEGTLLEYYY